MSDATTRVRSGWLVAWDGARQRWTPRGELIVRGDRVVHAGGPWTGPVDHEVDASDALVAPGIVDAHVHAGPLLAGRHFDDHAGPRADELGFLRYAARPDPADAADRDAAPGPGTDGARGAANVDAAARATVADLLRGGVTTFVEFGGETGVPAAAMRAACEADGPRLVSGVGFRTFDYVRRHDGTIAYARRPDGGRGAFRAAVADARSVRERNDPRLGAMLFPMQIDTCEPSLLRDAYAAAEDLDVPLQVHAAQTAFELAHLARDGDTPVRRLAGAGALGPRTQIAHGILLDHHPRAGRARTSPDTVARDVDEVAAAGAAVVHCPVAMARRGLALHSYAAYRDAGIDVLIGTDTYPRDPVAELRWAMYLSRVVDGAVARPTAWDVLESATSLAADRIGRPDLGRLAPGARADFLVVPLGRERFGAVVDPVAAWIHGGVAESTRETWVAGRRAYAAAGSAADGAAAASARDREAVPSEPPRPGTVAAARLWAVPSGPDRV